MKVSVLKKTITAGLLTILSFSAHAELNKLTEVTDFGSNPGSLKMYKYVPENVKSPTPMVVAIHACTQNAEMYNDENDWALMADRYGFIVMFPETNTSNQARGCFTWYEPSDYNRGKGEALSITNMVTKMKAEHNIDDNQVFVTGLSAGACMAANMIASYPDVFKGAAIHAGVPYGSATSLIEGMNLYDGAFYDKTPEEWGDLFRGAHEDSGYTGPMPKISIIFGTADHRFNPQWAFEQLEGYFNIHGIDGTPDEGTPYAFRKSEHYTWSNAEGEQVIEMWHMTDMLHVQTVDPCEEENPANCDVDKGGHLYSTDDGERFEHTEDWDLWGSYYSAKFFGIVDDEPKPLSVNITAPKDGATVADTIIVTANAASDNEDVSSVEFYTNDNTNAECIDTEAPYECAIDTTLFVDGDLAITAKAYAITEEAEDTVNVTVQNIVPICQDWEATVSAHETAGRAYSETTTEGETCWGSFCYGGTEVTRWYAVGSNEDLGTSGSETISLKEETQGIFEQGTCPDEDTVAPVITLVGDVEITIYKGQAYSDAGATATDNVDGDITTNITVTGSVNTAVVGTYELTYSVSDAAGNAADEVTRTVTVIADTIAPEITLNGDSSISVDLNGTFTDPGATALDNLDGDISANIVVTGSVDTSTSGTYELKYNVSDAAGNAATEVIRTITVAADTVAPVITILGHNPMSIWQNDPFEDPGATATDNVDGDITANIVVTGSVDNTTAGTYTLTYTVSDTAGNEAVKTRDVYVSADSSKPSLVLEGDAEITIYVGETFIDPGATSIDNRDGNISANIIVSGTVDNETAGTYELVYNVSDAAGNSATPVTRTVHVIADTIAPVITIIGSNTITLNAGQAYNEQGATATDNKDGDVSANIIIDSNVDTETEGTYQVTYNVSDVAGNQAEEVVRTVIVNPAITCTDYTDTAENHETAGRAYSETTTEGETCYGSFCWGGTEVTTWYAVGSDDDMGTSGSSTVTLKEIEGGYTVGECPAEPTAPVVESFDVVTLDYYKAVITGVASDADGDIDRVVLGLGAVTGFNCEGTTNFTCTLNWDDYGFQVGGEISVSVAAYDTRDEISNIETTLITRPESQAPVISNIQQSLSGSMLTVTLTVNDIEGDIDLVKLVRIDDMGGIDCENTAGNEYSCSADLIGTTYATMVFKAMALDLTENLTESEEFTVEWYGEVESCFTATNSEHASAGRAEERYGILYYALGSGSYLGQSSDTTSLEETSDGIWESVSSCN